MENVKTTAVIKERCSGCVSGKEVFPGRQQKAVQHNTQYQCNGLIRVGLVSKFHVCFLYSSNTVLNIALHVFIYTDAMLCNIAF